RRGARQDQTRPTGSARRVDRRDRLPRLRRLVTDDRRSPRPRRRLDGGMTALAPASVRILLGDDRAQPILTGYTGFSPLNTRATSAAHLVCSSLSASTE